MVQVKSPLLEQDAADRESAALDSSLGGINLARDLPSVPALGMVEEGPFFDSLPILAPAPVPAIDQAALGEILADSLFGDVIELSDLIPHLLTPVAEPAVAAGADVPDAAATAEAGDCAGMVALPFNILFEEDGSSGHGTL